MKKASENVHYFAAYPLRALNLPEEEYQSALQGRQDLNIKPMNRVRVFPMVNPYKESDFLQEGLRNDDTVIK